jgi:peroxiredoxin
VREDVTAGGKFPDYELADHTKTRHNLSKLQGNDPMFLAVSRGHYCPTDAGRKVQKDHPAPQLTEE